MQQQDNVTIRIVFKCGGLADETVECKAADNVWETKVRRAAGQAGAETGCFLNFPQTLRC
jgi:hypothetical protein